MPTKTFIRLDPDKKEKIMRAAIEEFELNGFERAKVESIANAAGIAKGSIYQYFKDKVELFLYAASWALEYFMDAIDHQTPLQELDIFTYFEVGIAERFSLIKQEPLLIQFTGSVMSGRFGGLTSALTTELWKTGERYTMNLIKNGQKNGTVRTDISDELLYLFFSGAIEKIENHIFKLAGDSNFSMDEEQFDELKKSIGDMVRLIREGIGR